MKGEIEKLKENKRRQIIDKILKLQKVSGIRGKDYENMLREMMMKEFD